MKLLKSSLRSKEWVCARPVASMRIVALSATLPNVEDLSEWLECESSFSFGPDYRPVQLDTHVVGFNENGKNGFMFEKSLNYKVRTITRCTKISQNAMWGACCQSPRIQTVRSGLEEIMT